MNGTVPPYPKEYRHEHEGKQKLKKGICDSWCQGRQRHGHKPIGGDKTVPTEALQLEYTV